MRCLSLGWRQRYPAMISPTDFTNLQIEPNFVRDLYDTAPSAKVLRMVRIGKGPNFFKRPMPTLSICV